MTEFLHNLKLEIGNHPDNAHYSSQGFVPLFVASPESKILIVGQAPGIHAQTSNTAWNDASGDRLMQWLGVTEDEFRNPSLFAHVPMDFYYPGKGKSGDLPPRKGFASLWHTRIVNQLPNISLTVLIGRYAQEYYLRDNRQATLTETVRNYRQYLPTYFPLVHPSPLNFRWFPKNPWFETELIPDLQATVSSILKS